MIKPILPIEPTPNRFDIAKGELMQDLYKAFDEGITDFELAYDGMKPDWIREKVHWMARGKLWTRAVSDAVDAVKAKYPDIYLAAHIDSLTSYKAFVKVKFVKDEAGEKHVMCHMNHDLPMSFLRQRVKMEIEDHNTEHPEEPWEAFDWEEYYAANH